MEALLARVSEYELIGLGEGSHGSYKNGVFRARAIKKLIEEHGVREVFLEDDVFGMIQIEAGGLSRLAERMNELQYCFDNAPMRNLYTWILTFNKAHPKDKVRILGADIQRFNVGDISDDSALGKLYRRCAKYARDHERMENATSARDAMMAKMIQAQHKAGVKAVLMFHNDHLNKSAVHSNMGHWLKKAYGDKYVVVANTFIRGTYHGFFMGYTEGLKNEFQVSTVHVKDRIYDAAEPTFLPSPPAPYLWEGHGGVDKRDPYKEFKRKSSHGFDAVLLINDETPLRPFKANNIFKPFSERW
jgi:erythromycin esterase-like protein